uniref:Uncharacterized mitochondrial protein AtMg00810-like n=1 Tax=Nicotiana tabacum TaxID=4097 RepID=A0A1S3X3A9_TOBAC|nr:PREDICTED: uncharacterized mitochondrial protein AtMg00810-like [Nicotiana tabacum]
MFTKNRRSNIVVILIYVDDMLVTGNNLQMIEDIKRQLHQSFKIKDLEELRYFLGIEFSRSHKGILMNQRKYALELISDLGLSAGKPSWTPLDSNQKFTTRQLDALTGLQADEPLVDREKYQRLIGKLLYLTLTRLDIAFSVQTLSQFLQEPKQSHWEATLRIVRYVMMDPGIGVLMSSKRENKLTAFCDADWASCPNTRRSVT